jgi:ribonucleoside-diphosphate reductase alpha chain
MPKAERPKKLEGYTHKVQLGCGNAYVTISLLDGKPFEVFATMGKAGGCTRAQLEGLSRLVSLGLRYGIPVKEIVDELKEIKCPDQMVSDGTQWWSCPDVISTILNEYDIKSREGK